MLAHGRTRSFLAFGSERSSQTFSARSTTAERRPEPFAVRRKGRPWLHPNRIGHPGPAQIQEEERPLEACALASTEHYIDGYATLSLDSLQLARFQTSCGRCSAVSEEVGHSASARHRYVTEKDQRLAKVETQDTGVRLFQQGHHRWLF